MSFPGPPDRPYGEIDDGVDHEHRGGPMPTYVALTYTADVIRGGVALYPTATATTVRVRGGKGGDVVTSDGPYAETKEVLTGFYTLECADLDEAIAVAARIPAAWHGGAVEVRPVFEMETSAAGA
jgi:hypothetical protein